MYKLPMLTKNIKKDDGADANAQRSQSLFKGYQTTEY